MSGGDRLDLELRSDPCELTVVREAMRNWLSGLGWAEAQIAELRKEMSELKEKLK